MTESIEIPVSEVPTHLLDDFRQECWRHMIGFAVPSGGSTSDDFQDIHQAGSATLVKVGSVLALLTAAHVADVLLQRGRFGVVVKEVRPGTQFHDANHFHFIRQGTKPYSAAGPDVAAIVVPPAMNHVFERCAVALNMPEHCARAHTPEFDVTSGLTGIFGFLNERTRFLPGPDGRDGIKAFSAVGAVGIARVHSKHRFDTIAIEAYRDGQSGPRNWEGISGGGLWNVSLSRTHDERISFGRPVFCGVAYYQGDEQPDHRVITGHGPSTLNQMLVAIGGA